MSELFTETLGTQFIDKSVDRIKTFRTLLIDDYLTDREILIQGMLMLADIENLRLQLTANIQDIRQTKIKSWYYDPNILWLIIFVIIIIIIIYKIWM